VQAIKEELQNWRICRNWRHAAHSCSLARQLHELNPVSCTATILCCQATMTTTSLPLVPQRGQQAVQEPARLCCQLQTIL
jgi:hypothetical protein